MQLNSNIPGLEVFILLFILAAFSFLFSASEAAVIGLNKIRLRHMVEQGVKRAQHIQRLVANLDKFIAALLIGNNLINIAISAIVTGIFINILGYNLGIIVATFAVTFCVLVFCEITPKMLATKHTEKTALFSAPFMEILIKLLNPIVVFFIGISNFILRLFGMKPAKRSPLITEEELRMMIEVGREEGFLSDEERKMLHCIFEFGETKVSDVMVPKEKIIAVSIKASPDEILNTFAEEGHARLPVYEGSVDNIIGIIYARDLLYVLREKELFVLEDLIHKVYSVPGILRVNELLRKFQADKIQIAIITDERQRALGMVTLEDLIEEIVGEIEEGHSGHH